MINKKAQLGEATIWVYRFIIMIVLISGIVFVIVKNYSYQYDVRPLEASLLSGKIASYLGEDPDHFNPRSIEEFVKIDQDIFMDLKLGNLNFSLGNTGLPPLCGTDRQRLSGKNLPYCFKDSYIILENGVEKNLEVFIVIGKSEKNV